MNIMTESKHYQVLNEYEKVFLRKAEESKLINIGDFYGDPQIAIISDCERYCVMAGCGLIIYYLEEPFQEYTYDTQSTQWREWGRNDLNSTVWIKNVVFLDNEHIEIETEDSQQIILSVNKEMS